MRISTPLLLAALAALAPAADERPTPPSGVGVTTFAPVVKRVAPSVVTVFSSKAAREVPEQEDIPPALRRFFGVPDEEGGGMSRPQQGLGSGVIISADGLVLTNNHVVEGADEVKIGLYDQRTELVAKVVGTDDKSDLAVLRVDPGEVKLLPIEWGDSSQVQVGDVVLAVGNPFGVGQTVTSGIISATGRGFGLVDYEDFLQTDAAINRGNSGGALVDVEGRLIGINTAILSPSGVNLGIGFAVPSNFARSILDQIVASGKVVRGYLGVVIQPITDEIAREWKLPSVDGALVADVAEDGPAAKAGLREGDVIVAVDGREVRDPRQLRLHVAQLKPGAQVAVAVIRDGERTTLDATVGDLADSTVATRDRRGAPGFGRRGALGLGLGDLDDAARERLGVPERIRGAVVTDLRPGSPAAEAGLKRGDVVVSVNREPVRSAEQAARLLRELEGRSAILRVWSEGGTRYVVLGDEDEGEDGR